MQGLHRVMDCGTRMHELMMVKAISLSLEKV